MSFVLFLHSGLRWLILIFALLTIVSGVSGMGGARPFGKSDKRNAMILMICCDIQLLLGFILYFVNGYFNMLTTGGAAVMKNKAIRFFVMEHNVGMIIAIVLIHIMYSATKKDMADSKKFKRMFWLTAVALVVILISIPWPNSGLTARPLFRGM